MITIYINQQEKNIMPNISLQELIGQLNLTTQAIAIAVNQTFVARGNYPVTLLQQHDKIDIVSPMQGG